MTQHLEICDQKLVDFSLKCGGKEFYIKPSFLSEIIANNVLYKLRRSSEAPVNFSASAKKHRKSSDLGTTSPPPLQTVLIILLLLQWSDGFS